MEDLFTFYQSRPMPAIMTVPTPSRAQCTYKNFFLSHLVALIRFQNCCIKFWRINPYCNFRWQHERKNLYQIKVFVDQLHCDGCSFNYYEGDLYSKRKKSCLERFVKVCTVLKRRTPQASAVQRLGIDNKATHYHASRGGGVLNF